MKRKAFDVAGSCFTLCERERVSLLCLVKRRAFVMDWGPLTMLKTARKARKCGKGQNIIKMKQKGSG